MGSTTPTNCRTGSRPRQRSRSSPNSTLVRPDKVVDPAAGRMPDGTTDRESAAMFNHQALIGLIGANIMKSLAPALHIDAFAAAGIAGHYHLMDVDQLPARTLPGLLDAVKTAGFIGVNITFPFKQAVMPLLDELSPEARQTGAVNTVTISHAGRTTGYNTD